MINKLSEAMADFQDPLPVLGVWETVAKAADSLSAFSDKDQRLAALLPEFKLVDKKVRSMETLYPAHGDAHPRNLIASSTGWRWNDFEDISLMPRFWDLASFIGNTTLFHGLKHPVVDYVLTRHIAAKDKASFLFALKSRVLMSTISNLSMALGGNGDLDFAYSQLERINDLLSLIDKEI
jgi:thiamine kinase-like enzyme